MSDRARIVVRQLNGWRWLKALVLVVVIALTGCFGPYYMHDDIQKYNKAVVDSEEQMLLFNIGRLHDEQPPHFMMVSTVAQTRTFSAGLSFQWTQLWNSLVAPSLAKPSTTKESGTFQAGPFTAGVNENPTIQFVPIQGQEFAGRFEAPLTDKFSLFLEDQIRSAPSEDRADLILFFAQSLKLTHGDRGKCQRGLYFNRRVEQQELKDTSNGPRYYDNRRVEQENLKDADASHLRYYFSEFSDCVREISNRPGLDFEKIDGGSAVPTTTSIKPAGADVVTALQQNLKWTENGDKFVLTTPVRIPALLDYSPKLVAPLESKPQSGDALPPVFFLPSEPNWKDLSYLLPKDYKLKVYQTNKDPRKSTGHVYLLVPDGYELERDADGNLRLDENGHYIARKPSTHVATGRRTKDSPIISATGSIGEKDVGRGIVGRGILAGTTIVDVDAKAGTATMSANANDSAADTMSIGDVDQISSADFSYADEVVSDVWPVPWDYLYVELRQGVDAANAERLCHSQPDNNDQSSLICGYFKVGNLLQIMHRLATMACTDKGEDKDSICPESFFGIGSREDIPPWADRWAPYTYQTKAGGEETKWVWVPAHAPNTQGQNRPDLAQRDRKAFFMLYKLYQMSLVDTSKLVTGTLPITIGK
jgi:hypothetical protein